MPPRITCYNAVGIYISRCRDRHCFQAIRIQIEEVVIIIYVTL